MFKNDAVNKTEIQAWAKKLEAGTQDDPTLTLAVQLQTERPSPLTIAPAFKYKLRQDLLQRYEPARFNRFHLPRWAGTAVFLSLITIGIFMVWMTLRTTTSSVQGDLKTVPPDALKQFSPLGNSGLHLGYVSAEAAGEIFLYDEPGGAKTISVTDDSPLLLTGETAVFDDHLWLQIRNVVANNEDKSPNLWVLAERIASQPTDASKQITPFREDDKEIAYLWSVQQLSNKLSTTVPSSPLPGSELQINITWLLIQPPTGELKQFVHLLDADSNLVMSWDTAVEWTAAWETGELRAATQTISLPDDLSTGTYTLQVGLYNAQTGQRLMTNSEDTAVQISSLTIDPVDVDQVWVESIGFRADEATPGKLPYDVVLGYNLVSAPEGVLKLLLAHPEWEARASEGTRALINGLTDFVPVTADEGLVTLSFTVEKAEMRAILQTDQPVLVVMLGAQTEQEFEVYAMPTFAIEDMFDLSR